MIGETRKAADVTRVLITGGAGFIGSNLVDELLVRGADVAVVDDLSTGRREHLADAVERGARLHVVDVRRAEEVDDVFAFERPDIVFHLAAQVDVRASIADPGHDALTNIVGTVNVLEAARSHGCRRLVNTSTGGAIYGEVREIPTPESVAPKPLSAYGESKRCAERYCAWARRLHGLDTVTLRYGNVYGPRQRADGDGGVVAIFCHRAALGRRPIIFGDGHQTRDYVHVSDIVRANLVAARAFGVGGIHNVGTQDEVSVLELLGAVRLVAGLTAEQFEPVFRPARRGEVRRSCLDASRARAELGFVPQMSLLEGVAATYAWLDARLSAAA